MTLFIHRLVDDYLQGADTTCPEPAKISLVISASPLPTLHPRSLLAPRFATYDGHNLSVSSFTVIPSLLINYPTRR